MWFLKILCKICEENLCSLAQHFPDSGHDFANSGHNFPDPGHDYPDFGNDYQDPGIHFLERKNQTRGFITHYEKMIFFNP